LLPDTSILHRSARLERNECHEVFVSDKLVNTVRTALANAGRGYSDQNSATQTLKLASDARPPDSSPHRLTLRCIIS
jgi:hypothetical protein